jgi:hypothetical protein
VVEIDDDLIAVRAWSGEGSRHIWHRLTNPEDILQIIENGVQIAEDLDISAFGWGKNMNTAYIKADHKPIVPVALVANAFGVRGKARHRRYDEEMIGRASVDWTLRTLLHDRCVMVDKRVFFDCGAIFGGTGGNAGIFTAKKYEVATKRLKDTWGAHVKFGGDIGKATSALKKDRNGKRIPNAKGERQVSLRVKRQHPAAAK